MPARVALFNIRELSTATLSEVDEEGAGRNPQIRAAADVIQRVRPDVLVLNEIDHDYADPDRLYLNLLRLQDAYLTRGDSPIAYPHFYVAPCNTGILTGVDLNGDGVVATPDDIGTATHAGDCHGYGLYPGQYSMALLSRFPIDPNGCRSFQNFLWKDLPGNHIPPDFFPDEALEVLRLSSKSHWDVPLVAPDGRKLHILMCHPTPRGFDGPEDSNGRRNFDEILFWERYLAGDPALVDDDGSNAPLDPEAAFVVMGDLNCPPDDPGGESNYANDAPAARLLLDHPRVQDTGHLLTSQGAALAAGESGPPRCRERDTLVGGYGGESGVRFDYALPSVNVGVLGGGVFWPTPDEDPEGAALAEEASDHRLVWLDIDFG